MDVEGVEIYVRVSGGAMINFYMTDDVREKFRKALMSGEVSCREFPINLELSVLPEWVTDEKQRRKLEKAHEIVHVRIPITHINF